MTYYWTWLKIDRTKANTASNALKKLPKKARKPGRPRVITRELEPVVVELYKRGYGYRAIARILRTSEYRLNPHFSSIRQTLMRLGTVGQWKLK